MNKNTKNMHLLRLQSSLSILASILTVQVVRWCPEATAAYQERIRSDEAKAMALAETACGYGYAFLSSNWYLRGHLDRYAFVPPTPFAVESEGVPCPFNPENESFAIKIEPLSDDGAVVCAVASCSESTAVFMIEVSSVGVQANAGVARSLRNTLSVTHPDEIL
jgi:hypothetical protein